LLDPAPKNEFSQKLHGMQTGIVEDFQREFGQPMRNQKLPATPGAPLQQIDPTDIGALAQANYPDDLLEGK